MELSQSSLAMLLLGGFPAGCVLNLAYALTDISAVRDGLGKRLLCHVKDFIFVLIAGLAAVLLVYYVNDGEFRYLVVVGMICGFAASHMTLGRLVILARNALARVLTVPLVWIWSKTLGRAYARTRAAAQIKSTQTRANALMLLASNGFEN